MVLATLGMCFYELLSLIVTKSFLNLNGLTSLLKTAGIVFEGEYSHMYRDTVLHVDQADYTIRVCQ